jgi:hypothetical protein
MERANRAVASSVRPYSSNAMNWPRRSLNCPTRKRLKPTPACDLSFRYIAPQHCVAPLLRLAIGTRQHGGETKFADQLSSARHFSVSLSIIEGHLA